MAARKTQGVYFVCVPYEAGQNTVVDGLTVEQAVKNAAASILKDARANRWSTFEVAIIEQDAESVSASDIIVGIVGGTQTVYGSICDAPNDEDVVDAFYDLFVAPDCTFKFSCDVTIIVLRQHEAAIFEQIMMRPTVRPDTHGYRITHQWGGVTDFKTDRDYPRKFRRGHTNRIISDPK